MSTTFSNTSAVKEWAHTHFPKATADDVNLIVRLMEALKEVCEMTDRVMLGTQYTKDTYTIALHQTRKEGSPRPLQVISAKDVNKLLKIHSKYVRKIVVKPRTLAFTIEVSFMHGFVPSPPVLHTPPTKMKRRKTHFDWEVMGITDEEDQNTIEEVVERVYHVQDRIPDILTWIEFIGGDGVTVREKHGRGADSKVKVPHSDEVGDGTASESCGPALEECDRTGYAILFENMPEFNAHFLVHLHTNMSPRVQNVYVWYDAPDKVSKQALLVVLVPRSNSEPQSLEYEPVGFRPSQQVKRVRFA